MLNTHQSQKRNSWKYILVIPALIGFVVLFQIKTIAQERDTNIELAKSLQHREEIRLVIDKNATEAELKEEAKRLKENHGITLKCSKIKRNDKGEITAIKVEYKDKKGNKGVSQVDGKEPIAPIHFYKNNEAIGFGRPKNFKVYANVPGVHSEDSEAFVFNFNDSLPNIDDFNFDFEIPEIPEIPEMPEAPEVPEVSFFSKMPDVPERLTFDNEVIKVVVKKDGQKPLVIINGKVVEGDENILSKVELDKIIKTTKTNNGSGDETQIIINGNDVTKFRADAMANVKVQMSKQKEVLKKEMARAREEMERARPEIERAKREMELSKPEIEKAKAEMEKAKAEMIKAREEMQKAKAELDKAREELKKTK